MRLVQTLGRITSWRLESSASNTRSSTETPAYIIMTVHVFGNVAVDEFFHVKAIPAPGQSMRVQARHRDLGGKGANQAIITARAGIDVRLISFVGNDDMGLWAERQLAAEGLGLGSLARCHGSSDVSVIVVDESGENIIVTTDGAAGHLTSTMVEAHICQAHAGDILLLQGNFSPTVTGHALQCGRIHGLTQVFNPSPVHPEFSSTWSLLDLAVLNQAEALELTGEPDVHSAGRCILANGARQVVITLGRAGAILMDHSALHEIPAAPIIPVDATGAGDTFAGILVAVLARTGTIDARAVVAATEAAAVTVSRPGTRSAFPTREEILAILARYDLA
ncbi:MAG: ribokinase [Microvirga sp.]